MPCCKKKESEEDSLSGWDEQLKNRSPSRISHKNSVSAECDSVFGHDSSNLKSKRSSLDCPSTGTPKPYEKECKHQASGHTHESQQHRRFFFSQSSISATAQPNGFNSFVQPPDTPNTRPQSETVQSPKKLRYKLSLSPPESLSFDNPAIRPLSRFIEEVYDKPDWDSLGHFAPLQKQVSVEGGIAAVVAASKWKAKALGVTRERRETGDFEREARTVLKVPAFVPGKVLHITTRKEPVRWCPGLTTRKFDLSWKANEDFCLIRLDGGSPLSSHMPNTIDGVFNTLKKECLFTLNLFSRVEHEHCQVKRKDLRDAEKGLCQNNPRIVRDSKDKFRGDNSFISHSSLPHQDSEDKQNLILHENRKDSDLSHSHGVLQRQERVDNNGDDDEHKRETESQPPKQQDVSEAADTPRFAYVEVHCANHTSKPPSSML